MNPECASWAKPGLARREPRCVAAFTRVRRRGLTGEPWVPPCLLGSGVYFTWREIEIRGRPKPGVHLSGRTAAWAERVDAGPIELSMTHSRELAAAICVVSGKDESGA